MEKNRKYIHTTEVGNLKLDDTVVVDADIKAEITNTLSTMMSDVGNLDENASTLDIVDAYNSLLNALKSATTAILMALMLCLPISSTAAGLTPAQLDELTNAHNTAGIQHKYIPGHIEVYTKSQIDQIIRTLVESEEAPKQYAMFIIPLNSCRMGQDVPQEDVFTSFELKASTNNFTAAEESNGIIFWSPSPFVNQIIADRDHNGPAELYGSATLDGMRLYVENIPRKYDQEYAPEIIPGSQWIDQRRYTQIESSKVVDWNSYTGFYVVVIDPELCFRGKQTDNWLWNTNTELIWTFSRTTADGKIEKDGDGRPLWHQITPVRWFGSLPNWAQQDDIIIKSE